MRPRLLFMVEGQGDAKSVPVLAKRILAPDFQHLAFDEKPSVFGDVAGIVRNPNKQANFTRVIGALAKRDY